MLVFQVYLRFSVNNRINFAFDMIKAIKIGFCIIVASFSAFPFFFSFLPTVNTKMMMAALGLLLFFFNLAKGRTGSIDRGFGAISLWALGVSFASYLSMTINNTPDDSYLGYLMSMWVWLGAAYFTVQCIKQIDGTVSIEKIIWIFIGVAIFQCIAGILMYKFGWLESLFSRYVVGKKYMGVGVGTSRLHGIGCALDVGGARLGAILIMIAYLILHYMKNTSVSMRILISLMISFVFITVCGNMMGRTLTVGASLALAYIVYSLLFDKKLNDDYKRKFISWGSGILISGVALCVLLYNTDSSARELIRFGFEGFFNYFEKGNFETHSTDLLSEGLIFPESFHTWIIGDGHMASGSLDPYYIGPKDYGFYMNTDAGYSRFLFYFGIIGLSIFIGFFLKVTQLCSSRFPKARIMFYLMLAMNLIVWIKVSTDMFVMFAPFLCLTLREEEESTELVF